MKKLWAIALCAAVMLGIFSGCARSEQAYIPTGDALAPAIDPDSMDDISTTAPTEPVEEQELILPYYPDRSMNPFQCTDYTNRTLFSLLYQGLFTVDRTYTAQPMLCGRYSVSKDNKTYIFYPAEATFSDGSLVTAGDVLASLQAAKESAYYQGRFTHISGLELSEDGGVKVTLDCPFENLPILLDIPIVKGSQVDSLLPLGTGPYTMSNALGGAKLRRNNRWWCASRADLIISATSISLKVATSESQIRDSFQFDNVSLVCADPGSDSYADYRCDYELWDCENGIFLFLACSIDSKVFSDESVRAALTFAIDREKLASEYYRGYARAASLPASPLSPYYNTGLAARYAYDPDKFTEALSNSGYMGQTVRLLVNSEDSLRLRTARAIADMLEACGMDVTVDAERGRTYEDMRYVRNFDIYLGETKLSPNMDLSPFFSVYGSLRYGGLSDSATYALCLESMANRGNYYNLHRMIMEKGGLCPILFRSYAVYATRGLMTDLTPARDNVFFYSIGRTLEDAKLAS